MVEKVITPECNIVDFARYRRDGNAAGDSPGIPQRSCRHCGATLLEGESEDECSSAFNIGTPDFRSPRKFYAD
jgi:hypothetical protein